MCREIDVNFEAILQNRMSRQFFINLLSIFIDFLFVFFKFKNLRDPLILQVKENTIHCLKM